VDEFVYIVQRGRGHDGYAEAARALGRALVERGIGLVFGGGRRGMMGVLAETVLQGGGEAIGVIPRDLMDKGLELTTVTSLRVVETMHARKALMAGLSDGFIAMPVDSARRRSFSRPSRGRSSACTPSRAAC